MATLASERGRKRGNEGVGCDLGLDAVRCVVNIRVPSALHAPATASDAPVMMMQHDTGPMPPNALAPEMVDALRRAVQRYATGASASAPAPELRMALHAFAREAREKDIAPEHVLVTLKGIWQGLPEVESAHDHSEKTRLLQQIVTICIREYFAE